MKCLMWTLLLVMMTTFSARNARLLQFQDFYSQSFVPNAMQISYRLENKVGIYYNVTALESFPGKLLFSIFVRKMGGGLTTNFNSGAAAVEIDNGDEFSQNMLKYRNLDFCKTIESIRNFTTEHFHSESLLQATFINSCPLARGFYYIANGTIEDDVMPVYFSSGRFWMQFELVQVFTEVIKLVNVRTKWIYESHW